VGNVLHHVKERENCPGGKCPGKIRLGEMSRGDICPRENVQGESLSGSLRVVSKTNRRHGRGGVCFHQHNFK